LLISIVIDGMEDVQQDIRNLEIFRMMGQNGSQERVS